MKESIKKIMLEAIDSISLLFLLAWTIGTVLVTILFFMNNYGIALVCLIVSILWINYRYPGIYLLKRKEDK